MQLVHQHLFESQHVPARNVDIWLPPGYTQSGDERYPVVYMHDGQNLFDPATSFAGVDWGIDPTLLSLIEAGEITPPIVVGIWNTSNRLGEYMPEKPLEDPHTRAEIDAFMDQFRNDFEFFPAGDDYLAFIVEELKPWVDAEFRTRSGQTDTYMIGSSIGALISLYAICRFPEVFRGAGCLSSAWYIGKETFVPWFADNLPDPIDHNLYFDMGGRENVWPKSNRTLLRKQAEMDEAARLAGYRDEESLLSLVFPYHKHHESYWRERIDGIFRFFLR